MLNISKTNISGKINKSKLKSFNQPHYFMYKKIVSKVILVIIHLVFKLAREILPSFVQQSSKLPFLFQGKLSTHLNSYYKLNLLKLCYHDKIVGYIFT